LVDQKAPQELVAPSLLLEELHVVVHVGSQRVDEIEVTLPQLLFLKIYDYLNIVLVYGL